ncbi:MAG: hypothetical protein RQ758_03580 [Methanomicrobiaceae archaeon]|nr:hypothetical protein [Methanomicrobiaceae archaeon]
MHSNTIGCRSYWSPLFLALTSAFAIALDYTLTCRFAENPGEILMNEFSPVVRFAIENQLFFQFLLVLMGIYFLVSYAGLRLLSRSRFYRFGVAIVLLVALTHVLGGLSWYFRDPLYSAWVQSLVIALLLFALAAASYTVFSVMKERKGERTP